MIRLFLVLSLILSTAYGAAVRCSHCPLDGHACCAELEHDLCHNDCENPERASHAHERPLTPTAVQAQMSRIPMGVANAATMQLPAHCCLERLSITSTIDSRANPWQLAARSTVLQI